MSMASIFKDIKSFRLGYTQERPYPWRWTTPVVLCAFLLISPFLAIVNVPLSAYNIVQEFTYQPNDTLPPVFLSNLVPSVLQNPTDGFTPQLFKVGDTIVLDDYIFEYTIDQVFDGIDTSKPASAFSYYNNPLSDSCDVTNMTLQLLLTKDAERGLYPEVQVSGTVACYVPSLFYLTWAGFPSDGEIFFSNEDHFFPNGEISIRDMPSLINDDFDIYDPWYGPNVPNATQAAIDFTVHACCDCDAVLAGAPLERGAALLESPCSSNPPDFIVVDAQPLTFTSASEDDALRPPPPPMKILDLLAYADASWNTSLSMLDPAYRNLIQTFYHLVRVDLGVILQNQIYKSPEMFNSTIISTGIFESWANKARNLTLNTTLMAQWHEEVEFYQNNERVPQLEYLRSVPRLKPQGSAVTSVFVSTFAMLSVIWTVFTLVAGAIARKHSGKLALLDGKKETLEQSRTWDKRLESGMDELDGSQVTLLGHQQDESVEQLRRRMDRNELRTDRNEMRTSVALARITAALIEHGIMKDVNWEDDGTVD
ncbi:hypothetical protein C8R45DRAFT_1156804 [Mycena sanguinolenta]|nr:hypothetical protein C8R45DRAFT_1156804 [Mycena sanguinolenta]